MLYAVIMAGGSGTRFWPESRMARPKQLLRLADDRSMIRAAIDRLSGICPLDRCLVVTNEKLQSAIAAELPGLDASQILGEPCKRDTAPCIGLASHWIERRNRQATMLVMPADHVIRDQVAFQSAVQRGAQLIEEDPRRIVTFGIKPTYPSEAFGYIERGERHSSQESVFRVARFREKPDRETAARYLETGRFFWNAGIFMWRVDAIQRALQTYEPEMSQRLGRIAEHLDGPQFSAVLAREFPAITGKSIDYAVLEKSSDVWMIEAPFDWDDVGTWSALPRLHPQDTQGNTVQGRHVGIETSDCIIRGEANHLIVTLGMKDCIIVQTADATLIVQRGDEEKLRQVVKELESRKLDQYL